MRRSLKRVTAMLLALVAVGGTVRAEDAGDPLRVGVAGHAFDHLGGIADQAETAAAAGCNIIYSTGFGSVGYSGLPGAGELGRERGEFAAYVRRAKAGGIRLAIGYVCATSIVGVEGFGARWTPEFRGRFSGPPAGWLQEGRDGGALPSWYGGEYRPACMNNPDWREYEKAVVRLQLEAGYDGIFFDNPTVHPQGCYCRYCMGKFAAYLKGRGVEVPAGASTEEVRKLAVARREDFLRFRGTIARDFLGEMRAYARTINPRAVVTCNNSLNTPGVFYSQCREYGYDIEEMSRVEDWVTVEDMATQPRTNADGSVVEYGPVYELIHAIGHGKPVVAINLVDGDYHTPADLVRLSMAEAAAHGASYLAWPTWPEGVRGRMAGAIRPEAEFLRGHAELLNETTQRADVVVYLPFGRWTSEGSCAELPVVNALGAANVQFRVADEEGLAGALEGRPGVLVVESRGVLTEEQRRAVEGYVAAGGKVVETTGDGGWLGKVREGVGSPSVALVGPAAVRVVVRDQRGRTIVHVLNLGVRRVSSFEDQVTPAKDVRVTARVPMEEVRSVTALSADGEGNRGAVPFTVTKSQAGTLVSVELPVVRLSTILVVE